MLRLSRDRVVIALAPDALALVLVEGSARRRIAANRVLRYEPALGADSWQAATVALRDVAAELKDVKADVTVVLSNHFVRYALVPPSEGLDRGEEELAFARYCFAKIHGARSKSWDVRMSGAGDADRLASAIDATLLETVRECFPPGGKLKLVSVQPYLMSAFNRWRATLQLERAWFMLVEPERLCIGLLENGRWTAVRNAKATLETPEQWAEVLDREQHLVACAEPPAGAYVHAPHTGHAGAPQVEGWSFNSLSLPSVEGLTVEEAAPLSMALCAA